MNRAQKFILVTAAVFVALLFVELHPVLRKVADYLPFLQPSSYGRSHSTLTKTIGIFAAAVLLTAAFKDRKPI